MGFGTGEAICTASDMAIWARALFSGELLDPATQQARLEGMSDTGSGLPYGMGIADLGGLIGHNGSVAGFPPLSVAIPGPTNPDARVLRIT